MKQTPERLYLDLMKKTLAFTMWPEPPVPITTFRRELSLIERLLLTATSKILSKERNHKSVGMFQIQRVSESERIEGRTWPGCADTMIGLKRLDNLQHCVETVLRDNIAGDFIETEVWRGGACVLMRAILAAHGIEDRKVFVADSFQGLPKPDAEKYPADRGNTLYTHVYLAIPKEDVERNFRKYGLLDQQVVFLQGWFKDTLPTAPIDRLSILRLDGDLYGSTMDVLENLYPKLSDDGFCIIDDYALPGCRAAVNDYRTHHAIHSELKTVDWTGAYWRK